MVVNRKQPVTPAPPISRSSSSQPVATRKQTKVSNAVKSLESKSAGNGHAVKSQPSSHDSTGGKVAHDAKKRKSRSWFDRIFLFGLTSFVAYAFYTCRPNPIFPQPSSYPVEPTLCRSLSTYRSHILEPFILPPLKHTLQLTRQVSEPYLREAKSHMEPYLEPVHQAISAVSPYAQSTVTRGKQVWQGTLKPLYTRTLKPYYETAVLPRYTRYIKPRLLPLEAKAEQYFAHFVSNPIRSKTNLVLLHLHQIYLLRLEPYIRVAKPHVLHGWTTASDVASRVTHHYNDLVHPSVVKIWTHAHPRLCAVWNQLKTSVIQFLEVVAVVLKRAAIEFGIYRRQYVDPHIRRIWEKVSEPSEDSQSFSATITPPSSTTSLTNDLQEVADDNVTAATFLESTPSTEAITANTIPASSTESSHSQSEVAIAPEVTPVLEATGPTSSLEGSATHIPIPPKIGADDDVSFEPNQLEVELHSTSTNEEPVIDSTVAAEVVETETVNSAPLATPLSETPVPVAEPTAQSASVPDDSQAIPQTTPLSEPVAEEDLEDFLSELGVGDGPQQPSTPEEDDEEFLEDPSPPRPTLSAEERKAMTAAKRADIEGRHEVWFQKVRAGIAEKGPELVKTLQKIRDEAAAEVGRLGSDNAVNSKDKDAAKDPRYLFNVQQDGERLIKGLEGYLRKAEGRSVDWKLEAGTARNDDVERIKSHIVEKEKTKFDDLTQKVETKFEEKVDGMRKAVHVWFKTLKDKEAEIVLAVATEVRKVAARGQEDLGMDYAWLDDVTYYDWQKYHDLMRLSEDFDQLVRMIANGTSTDPQPPSDPVVAALDNLDQELQDVAAGFAHSFAKSLARGTAIFSTRPQAEAEDGFFVVQDGQKRKDDLRGVDLGKVELKKEAVGTIPLKDSRGDQGEPKDPDTIGTWPVPPPAETPDDSAFDASKVIIGKDKVQIEEALKDVPLEPAAQRHEEL